MPSADLRPHGGADTPPAGTAGEGISRRRFMGYLIAGSTLIAAAPQFVSPPTARAALPTHQPVDDYDLSDLLNEAAAPTSGLISVTVNSDGTVSFALPRADVVLIPHTPLVAGGVAVRGQTFGQCIDAIRALDVTWEPGAVGTPSESDVLAELDRSELPLTPALPTARRSRRSSPSTSVPGTHSSPTPRSPMSPRRVPRCGRV